MQLNQRMIKNIKSESIFSKDKRKKLLAGKEKKSQRISEIYGNMDALKNKGSLNTIMKN